MIVANKACEAVDKAKAAQKTLGGEAPQTPRQKTEFSMQNSEPRSGSNGLGNPKTEVEVTEIGKVPGAQRALTRT